MQLNIFRGKGRLCSQKWMNFRSIFVSVMVPKMQRNIFLVWTQIEAHWSSSSHWHNRRPVEPPPPQHCCLHLLLQLLHPLLLHFHQLEHFTNFNILCQIFWDVYAVWFPHLWMFESPVLCVLSGGGWCRKRRKARVGEKKKQDAASVSGIPPILGFPVHLEAATPCEMSRWSDWRSQLYPELLKEQEWMWREKNLHNLGWLHI